MQFISAKKLQREYRAYHLAQRIDQLRADLEDFADDLTDDWHDSNYQSNEEYVWSVQDAAAELESAFASVEAGYPDDKYSVTNNRYKGNDNG